MGSCCQIQQNRNQPLLENWYNDGIHEDKLKIFKQNGYPYQAQVLYEYVGVDEDQLTIKPGEIIIILDYSEELNGWALATKIKKNVSEEGYIPGEWVRSIISKKEWVRSKEYTKALEILMDYKMQDLDDKTRMFRNEFEKIAIYWCLLFQDEKNKRQSFPSFIIDIIISHTIFK